ncbi:MAG: class I SAM-dependent DNA methyltransferase, partial [Asticcacaulis sp.]
MALYERRAEDWDRDRGRATADRPAFEASWLNEFLAKLVGIEVLDLGCGSGDPIARYLIERDIALTGVDSSPSLVSICSEKFPVMNWICADMRIVNLQRTFDGIIAWHSLIHLTPDDQIAMFQIFSRHARKGAMLMFTSGHAHGEVIGRWHGEPLYHGSLDPAEYKALLSANGFE